jgi:hypothetical protein
MNADAITHLFKETYNTFPPQLMWLGGRPTLKVAKVGGLIPVKR